MKTSSLLIPALLATLILGACKKPGTTESTFPIQNPFSSSEEPSPFPVQRIIKDTQGRPLDGTIVGKTADQLYVTRGYDGMNFKIDINSLEEADRTFAEELPLQVPPGSFELAPLEPPKEAPPYIATREDAIKRLEDSNKRLLSEAEASQNSMLRSSRFNEIERNTVEISNLKTAIAAYRLEHAELEKDASKSQ